LAEKNVFIGLGSNLGDRVTYLQKALEHLAKLGLQVCHASRLYETPPWGIMEQPQFLNAVARAETTLAPLQVLHMLLEAERRMGRERDVKWGPRIIDLDLLAYGAQLVHCTQLQVPHPLAAERAFVLVPWAEIAPTFMLANTTKTVQQLLNDLRLRVPNDVAAVRGVPQIVLNLFEAKLGTT
jgi:2-amino-4-hydroxy-6-hydroxymethyldihydropteridine diphosphokinase